MGFDQSAGKTGDAWSWTERQVEGARDWTGRQLENAGSALAQGGVAALGWVDRVVPLVRGHHYDTSIPLGNFKRVTPAVLLDAIRHNPQSFPIPGDRDFNLFTRVTLSFLGTRNPVLVESIKTSDPNRVSMRLRAVHLGNGSEHFFQGTAEHIIYRIAAGNASVDKEAGHLLTYEVIGDGPRYEHWDRCRINTLFGTREWPRLVRFRVLPFAMKLEAELAAAEQKHR